jgi:hypothetical protein
MAITDAGKMFESTSEVRVLAVAAGLACKAGSTVVIFLGGVKAGTLGVESVVDSVGNGYKILQLAGNPCVAIAWSRLSVALASTSTITITWNTVPGSPWISAHNFEGAGATEYDAKGSAATSTQAYVTMDVTGSDWLALGIAYFPADVQMTTTEVDSSISQDDSGAAQPYSECWSRNGTTGTTTRIGATIATAKYRKVMGITLLAQPLNTAKAVGGIFMGV